MRCPACGLESASGMKVCGECGSSLKLKCGLRLREALGIKFCGACGKPLGGGPKPEPLPDPRSYTPKHLAEKILQSKSALQGRAQTSDGALRRREGVGRALRAVGSRGVAWDHGPLLQLPRRRR